MQKAVFFDRDGVINSDEGLYYVFTREDFSINPGVLEFMKEVSRRGYLLIVISNQGGIARGLYSKHDADELHRHFLNLCSAEGIQVAEIYYCPHHTNYGNCLCRKPQSLMLEKAIARFGIDPSLSYFVGDRETDSQTANKCGVNTILIRPNSNLMEYLAEVK